MSTRERRMHTRITGHTGPEGGAIDAHMEPDVGVPGQFEGPLDGRLSGFLESERGREPITPRTMRTRPMPLGTPVTVRFDGRAMAPTNGNGRTAGRTIAELIRELSSESGDLVRQEVELAKAEMREKMTIFTHGMVSMGIGAVLLLCALLTGLGALNGGLTSLLAQFMSVDVAVWLSPLILTLCLGLAGWTLIQGAKARMADEGLAMRRTAATIREDTRWAQAKLHEVKEEAAHGR